jgi:hypothetical protein
MFMAGIRGIRVSQNGSYDTPDGDSGEQYPDRDAARIVGVKKLAFAGCEQGSGLDAAAERSGRNERAGRSGEWAAATTYESRIMQQS